MKKVFCALLPCLVFLIAMIVLPVFGSIVFAKENTITITDESFEPKRVTIKQGQEVVFVNKGKNDHWPASNLHPTHGIYPEFDPKQPIAPNSSWKFRFEKFGIFRFHDHLNPALTGDIYVLEDKSLMKSNFVPSPSPISTTQIPNLLKAYFLRIYYHFSPEQFKKDVKELNAHQVTSDPEKLKYWLNIIGGSQYMDKLIADTEGGSRVDCHQEAHKVGRTAFELFRTTAFGKVNYGCHSGYLHGAMEAFIKENGEDKITERVEKLCGRYDTDFAKFECLHGIGHGFTAYVSYDIPEALKMCQMLSSEYNRRSCFGGVFMENIMVAQGRGALVGHKTNWVSNDPHFPCNKVDQSELVQFECYQMQTSRMLDVFNYNFLPISAECLRAPTPLVPVCFRSMGRDIAGQTLRDPDQIIQLCQLSPPQYFNDCMTGGLNVIIDFWGETITSQPQALCNKLPAAEQKMFCFQVLGQRLQNVFGNNRKKIEEICKVADPLYFQVCLQSSLKV